MLEALSDFTAGLPAWAQWIGIMLISAIPFVESYFGAAIGVLLAAWSRGRLSPAAAMAWGLAWIAVGRAFDEPHSVPVAIAAVAAAVVVAAAAVVVRVRARSAPEPA